MKSADDASQKDPGKEGAAGYDDVINYYIHSASLESIAGAPFVI